MLLNIDLFKIQTTDSTNDYIHEYEQVINSIITQKEGIKEKILFEEEQIERITLIKEAIVA